MEHGVYVSLDMGGTWASIANNLPPVSVRDLRVHPREGDLIVGTHGRGAWILDDIRPLQDWSGANVSSVHLFPVRDVTRWHLHTRLESQGTRRYRAANPEYGAFVNLYVAEAPEEPISVTIRNTEGETVRVLDEIELEAGVNRIVWDLRHDAATAWKNAPTEGWGDGEINVLALPGEYTASVEIDGRKLRSSFEIKPDHRFDLSEQGYAEQSIATLALRDLLSETHVMLNGVDSTIRQLGELDMKLGEDGNAEENDEMSEMIEAALNEAKDVRALLTRPAPAMMYRDKPRLREEVRTLMRNIDGAVNAPTVPQSVRLAQLSDETKEAGAAYKKLMEGAVAEINSRVDSLPHILISAAD
jgi:hypothetical protein